MSGLKPLLVGILLTGLFAFALISGGIMLAENNAAPQSIGDDPALSSYKTSLEDTLEQAHTDANASIESLGKSPISVISGFAIFDAVYSVWKTLKVVPVTIFNLTIGLAQEELLGPSFYIVIGIISTILLILIIFGVIKMIISGQDE